MGYNNFYFSMPTKMLFGKDSIKLVEASLVELEIKKVAIVYGGTYIEELGIINELKTIFEKLKIKAIIIDDAKPNPDNNYVDQKALMLKDQQVDLMIGIGGGSAIDATKAIALQANNDQDFWTNALNGFKKPGIKVGVISTLPASGSETNNSFVIAHHELGQKIARTNMSIRPVFAVCDPMYSMSLPKYQFNYALIDIFSHLLEQLFTSQDNTTFIDNLIYGSLKDLVGQIEVLENDFNNFDARSNIILNASFALSYYLSQGRRTDWNAHEIEHYFSGKYKTPHGSGLGIIFPEYLKKAVASEVYASKLQEVGKIVFNVNSLDLTISKIEALFRQLNNYHTLSDLIKQDFKVEEVVAAIIKEEAIGKTYLLDRKTLKDILSKVK